MQSLALAFAASTPEPAATAAAIDNWSSAASEVLNSAADAASAAATEICWERSSISAHMCLMA